jgi:CRP-like cAMP-binding protein
MHTATHATIAPVRFIDPAEAADTDCGIAPLKTLCSTCHLKDLCLPCGLAGNDVERLDGLKFARRRIKEGQALYHEGDRFQFLYAVRSGTFKSTLNLKDGREQVTGFRWRASSWARTARLGQARQQCCRAGGRRIRHPMPTPRAGRHEHRAARSPPDEPRDASTAS